MKQTATNQFNDGLNLDLHPIVTPNSVLTDNLNGTFITYNGNEFCLQNDKGNTYKASLTAGFIPIGIKEHNGILYIFSCTEDGVGEIGTYPGLDWEKWRPDEEYIGEFLDKYTPIHSLVVKENGIDVLKDLRTKSLNFSLNNPITIDVQDSYDGSINLIFVDNLNKPRIINTRFSVLPNNHYKIINRGSCNEANTYSEETLANEASLILNFEEICNIDLEEVSAGGQLKGGNYTFYVKFGDDDFNVTDIAAESGIVSIFKGQDCVPNTISGTLSDERTDKMVHLNITNVPSYFSNIYIYYTREYSDTQGFRMSEACRLTEPFSIKKKTNGDADKSQDIWITGFEPVESVSIEDLNIDYHTIDYAKTVAQQQDMLFLGNVGQKETYQLYEKLRNYTLNIKTSVYREFDGLKAVDAKYTSGDEYYSTKNIYSKLGYWPDEIYRFGVVYILKDGSLTPVFNMCGGTFHNCGEIITKRNDIPSDTNESIYNEKGVFLTPKVDVLAINKSQLQPLYFYFGLPEDMDDELKENVNGWFVVRQKRIPRTICQGLSIGIDRESGLPLIWNGKEWIIQSFLSLDRNSVNSEQAHELLAQLQKAAGKKNSWWHAIVTYILLPTIGIVPTMSPLSLAALTGGIVANHTVNQKNYNGLLEVYKELQRPTLDYFGERTQKYSTEYFCIAWNRWEEYWNEFYEQWHAILPSSWSNPPSIYTVYDNYEQYTKGRNTEISLWKQDGLDYKLIEDIPASYNNGKVYTLTYKIYKVVSKHEFEFTKKILYYAFVSRETDDDQKYNDLPINQYVTIDGVNHKLMAFDADTKNWYNGSAPEDWDSEEYGQYKPIFYDDVIETTNLALEVDSKYAQRYISEDHSSRKGWGLLSLDPCVNPSIATIISGSEFIIQPEYSTRTAFGSAPVGTEYAPGSYNNNYLKIDNIPLTYLANNKESSNMKAVYLQPHTSSKVVDEYVFKNIAGNAVDKSSEEISVKMYARSLNDENVIDYSFTGNDSKKNVNLVRGEFCPFVGVASDDLNVSTLYSIRHKESPLDNLFKVRANDHSPYYCVSNRYEIKVQSDNKANVFRGDCYTNTVTFRVLHNFIDPEVPASTEIVDPYCWDNALKALLSDDAKESAKAFDNINLSDVNTVDLGYWVTYKCLSSYNLGLRSENPFNTQEVAEIGSVRSFYPISAVSTITGNKVEESFLLNDGYSATVGSKRYNLLENVPYTTSEFSNRILFSNKNVINSFINGYRVFQGLSYHDYDKQYGEIVKLVPWGNNLLCVFEHGIAMIGVNEQALMQTTTEQTIHIYGHGVLADKLAIISQDYGSKYADSVIRTALGIYGIDTEAKKIWRYTDKQGFETISDMKIESYLNNNLLPNYVVEIGKCDVRTHYNSFKGDVIFTWYITSDNDVKHEYSICYNERQSIWTSRYDWTPLVSENVAGEMFSLQKGEGYQGISIYDHDPVNSFPTNWYGKQHPFEFEFVVSDPIGAHKIFENLQIISNNVQPEELQFEFIGDSYMFNKARIYHTVFENWFDKERVLKTEYSSARYTEDPNKTEQSALNYLKASKAGVHQQQLTDGYKPFRNVSTLNDRNLEPLYGQIIKTDNATKQYHLRIPQECRNVESWGRRLGNIQYKNDSWFTTIDPLLYDARLNDPRITQLSNPVTKWNSARIRDKWCKIRVRYSGEDLAVITAIKTIVNI